jgi:hypothetical protein
MMLRRPYKVVAVALANKIARRQRRLNGVWDAVVSSS